MPCGDNRLEKEKLWCNKAKKIDVGSLHDG